MDTILVTKASMNDFIKNVRSTISEYDMIPQGTGVVAAVSGGPDSVAMLHALVRLSEDCGFRVIVAHFDHALRAESCHEALFVRELTVKLGVEYRQERSNVREFALSQKISIEEAGRLLRYDFLERVRMDVGVPVIAVAHHVDDQIETFFMRLLKGASLEGLSGIPPVRGNIVRPLIRTTRKQIISFLEQENISYVLDPSNLEVTTERNFVRNVVFPILQQRFKGYQEAVHRTIEVLSDENQILEYMAQELYDSSVTVHGNTLYLDRDRLLQSPSALRRRVVIKALYSVAGQRSRFGKSHLHLVEVLLVGNRPSGYLKLPYNIQIRRIYDSLCIYRNERVSQHQLSALTIDSPCIVDIPNTGVQLEFHISSSQNCDIDFTNKSTAYFDAELAPFPLLVRGPLPGDRMRPWGLQGIRKIKKFLIEAKIPVHLRRSFPLVVKDEEILWLPFVRRSCIAPISRHTRSVLRVSVIGNTDIIFEQSKGSIDPCHL